MTSPTDRALGPLCVHGQVDDGFGPVMDVGVGFAYVSNQMGGISDQRTNLLTAALRSCLRD